MNTDINEKKIHDMYEKISTPEYDPANDVISAIRSAPRKNIALKRIIIIGAILCLIGVALGAAELSGWQSFNLFGEKTGSGSPIIPAMTVPPGYESAGYTPIKRTTPEPEDPEIVEYNMRFIEETQEDEIRISITREGIGGYGGAMNSGFKTEDFSRIENIMESSISPVKMPSYVPEGYVFEKASMDFYVDERNLPELIYSESIDNRNYWIYKFKDGYEQKVSKISLTYSNEKDEEFVCSVSLCTVLADSIQHHVSESSVVETVDAKGFGEGIWIYDKKKEHHRNQLSLFKEIAPVEAVDLYNVAFWEVVDSQETSEKDIFSSDIEYISLVCNIYADTLGVEELIKIAESIN